ncbi:MAG: radical SAM protein [Nitrospirae bacterium]|nr:MAG: radical SAM protein [Nitrospirota bacterium]
MKITLLVPPPSVRTKVPERVFGCTYSYYSMPQLPLLYVGAVLEKDEHEVKIKDFTEGASYDDLKTFLQSDDSDVYIIHTVLLAESTDIKAAETIIDNTSASVVFFGPHPTLIPERFLFSNRCFVARGEPEYVVRDTVNAISKGRFDSVRGLSYLKNGEIKENETFGVIENLDELPLPARHLVQDKGRYFNPKLKERPFTLMLASRGCSYRCYYCVPNAISWAREIEWRRFHNNRKPPVKLRSAASIIKEFKQIKAEGYRAVSIIDDMFLFGGKQRIFKICDGIKDLGISFGILARCEFVVDEDVVKALAEAGCKYVDLGVESLEQEVLNDIRKDLDVDMVKEAVKTLIKYGIEPKLNIMFGSSPKETKSSIEKTIRGVSELPINYCMFLIATPFPGTEFYEKALERKWAVEPDIHDLENTLSPTDKALVSYRHLSREDLQKSVKRANRLFYLRPRRIIYQLKTIRNLKDIIDIFKTGLKVIR